MAEAALATLNEDLTRYLRAQELYRREHGWYSESWRSLGFAPSPGVTLHGAGGAIGYAVSATHQHLPNRSCVVRHTLREGDTEIPYRRTARDKRLPRPGVVVCDDA